MTGADMEPPGRMTFKGGFEDKTPSETDFAKLAEFDLLNYTLAAALFKLDDTEVEARVATLSEDDCRGVVETLYSSVQLHMTLADRFGRAAARLLVGIDRVYESGARPERTVN